MMNEVKMLYKKRGKQKALWADVIIFQLHVEVIYSNNVSY